MNVKLRSICEEDSENMIKWRMDPDITKWMYTDPVLTIEGQKQWIQKISNDKTMQYWVIIVDDIPIGIINLANIDMDKKESCWAYYIGEKNFRSIRLAMNLEWNLYDYVFDVLGLERLYSEMLSQNQGVIKLHQMCGSKIDDVYENKVLKNGKLYDVVEMSITKNQWKTLRNQRKYDFINFQKD